MGKDSGKAEYFVENQNYSVGIPVEIQVEIPGIGQGSGSFRGKNGKSGPAPGKIARQISATGTKRCREKQLFKRLNYCSSEKGRETPVRILESSPGFS